MKRRKIIIIGVLITIVSMSTLLLPLNSLFACDSDLSVDAPCIEEGSTTASVEFTMSGPSGNSWKYVLDVDGSTVWQTPTEWQWVSPQCVNIDLDRM